MFLGSITQRLIKKDLYLQSCFILTLVKIKKLHR